MISSLRPSNNLSERSTASFWFSGLEKSTNANLGLATFHERSQNDKKEARLAKKKAKKGGAEGEDGAEGDGAAGGEEKKSKPVPVEKRNSIWIGNLSFRTTAERIKEFLEKGVEELGGDEGSVTRVNLPKEKNKGEFGPSKG